LWIVHQRIVHSLTWFNSGLEIFSPFANLPSRKLEDYYKFIKYPVCLTWDAFEGEMSFIWRNAKDYNEDGSEMFDLAGQLEVSLQSQG
jgi:hypothetical protein